MGVTLAVTAPMTAAPVAAFTRLLALRATRAFEPAALTVLATVGSMLMAAAARTKRAEARAVWSAAKLTAAKPSR